MHLAPLSRCNMIERQGFGFIQLKEPNLPYTFNIMPRYGCSKLRVRHPDQDRMGCSTRNFVVNSMKCEFTYESFAIMHNRYFEGMQQMLRNTGPMTSVRYIPGPDSRAPSQATGSRTWLPAQELFSPTPTIAWLQPSHEAWRWPCSGDASLGNDSVLVTGLL